MTDLYVVIGLGVNGISCVRYLKKHGKTVAVMDTRDTPPLLTTFQAEFPDVKVILGGFDATVLQEAATIVISPGLALSEPMIAEQVQRGATIIGDIELFAQAVKVPVIAITGTNAKSTVTTLVGKMAEAAGYQVEVGGNLGIPALDLLEKNPTTNLFVLELSSFQLETTYSLKPQVATILNITPDHLDRYTDLAAYQAAKHRVYQNAKIVVCNRDDELTECTAFVQKKVYFTMQKPREDEFGLMTEEGKTYLAFGRDLLLTVDQLPVAGKHYQANALSALALGYCFGFPMQTMLQVLREFKGLPHRCQLVREINHVRWYNDSKGTNVGATQAAIEGLGSQITGKLILIAGGVGKNADFGALVPSIAKYCRHVVLIGETAAELHQLLQNHVATSFAHSMDEAVQQAEHYAQPNDCVLLSPACASYDMFKNFEHRGQVFTEIVEKI